ncbi:MAG: SBBP repeat-containing protein [Saprospiraceae bacterium]|nr:SBBP repeat-containing protein [Saprospiraceae bacterium]
MFGEGLVFNYPNFSVASNGDLLLVNAPMDVGTPNNPLYPDFGVLEVFRLDSSGNTLWKSGMLCSDPATGNNYDMQTRGVAMDSEGNVYISGYIRNDGPTLNLLSHFLIKLDPDGNPLIWKKMHNSAFEVLQFTNDAIYLLDKSQFDFALGHYNEASAIIAKFDHDLNLLWAKQYKADNFPYYTANITPFAQRGFT